MKKMFSVSLTAVTLTLLLTASAFADQSNLHRTRVTRLTARLHAPDGVVTEAKGRVREITKTKGSRVRIQLQGRVVIPIPSTIPALATPEAALAADVRLVLKRAGVAYAECLLDPGDVEEEDDGLEISYKLNLEQKVRRNTPRLVEKKGQCDIDLVTAGIQAGLPAVQDNDTVEAIVVDLSGNTLFLLGEF